MSLFQHPRYQANPAYLLFENYILDVLGFLPPEKARLMQNMKLQNILHTTANEWHQALKEGLALSDTIDIAIIDAWLSKTAQSSSETYVPLQFAMDFTDAYMHEASQVDVWTEQSLAQAKQRVATFHAKERRAA
jgi:hypothetical protein